MLVDVARDRLCGPFLWSGDIVAIVRLASQLDAARRLDVIRALSATIPEAAPVEGLRRLLAALVSESLPLTADEIRLCAALIAKYPNELESFADLVTATPALLIRELWLTACGIVQADTDKQVEGVASAALRISCAGLSQYHGVSEADLLRRALLAILLAAAPGDLDTYVSIASVVAPGLAQFTEYAAGREAVTSLVDAGLFAGTSRFATIDAMDTILAGYDPEDFPSLAVPVDSAIAIDPAAAVAYLDQALKRAQAPMRHYLLRSLGGLAGRVVVDDVTVTKAARAVIANLPVPERMEVAESAFSHAMARGFVDTAAATANSLTEGDQSTDLVDRFMTAGRDVSQPDRRPFVHAVALLSPSSLTATQLQEACSWARECLLSDDPEAVRTGRAAYDRWLGTPGIQSELTSSVQQVLAALDGDHTSVSRHLEQLEFVVAHSGTLDADASSRLVTVMDGALDKSAGEDTARICAVLGGLQPLARNSRQRLCERLMVYELRPDTVAARAALLRLVGHVASAGGVDRRALRKRIDELRNSDSNDHRSVAADLERGG
jgi:hypothetical protein